MVNLCFIDSCSKRVVSYGLCDMHRKRKARTGDVMTVRQLKHGLDGTPEHRTYKGMLTRCFNINAINYKYYGGRGIKVVEEWLGVGGFVNFLRDMGNKPSRDHTLERINNNGDYGPNNCKWATRVEQAANKRPKGSVVYGKA